MNRKIYSKCTHCDYMLVSEYRGKTAYAMAYDSLIIQMECHLREAHPLVKKVGVQYSKPWPV